MTKTPKQWLSAMKPEDRAAVVTAAFEKYRGKRTPPNLWRRFFTQEERDALVVALKEEQRVAQEYGVPVGPLSISAFGAQLDDPSK